MNQFVQSFAGGIDGPVCQFIQRASSLKSLSQFSTSFKDRPSNCFSVQLLLLAALDQYLQRRGQVEQQSRVVLLNALPVSLGFNGAAALAPEQYFPDAR